MTFVAGKQKLGVPLGVSGGANCWDDERTHVAGRRVSRNGDTFGYNARSEVIGAAMGTNSYGYAYDAIGNRVFSAVNAVTNTYTANCLNQYTAAGSVFPVYDADGNMRWDGRMWHTWDAENRLVHSEPGWVGSTNGAVRVVNSYDHRHRRIQKRVEVLTGRGAGYPFDPSQGGTWDVVETRTFIYDGWNLTAEVVVDAQTGTTNVTRYLWGPDVSGTLQGAGGVGGLLAVTTADLAQPNSLTTYYPSYDANGNVTDYVDGSGEIRAHYEYSPFGETIAQSGDLADTFTHRFSTKPFDAETSLVMYQLRPYAPSIGRWMSRDPIGEKGGLNLHAMCANNCLNQYDSLGLAVSWKKNCSCVLSSSDKKTIEEKLAKFSQWIDSVEKNGWKDLPDNFTVKRAKALSEKLRNINVSCRDGSLLCYNNTGWGWPFSSTVNICVKNIKNVYGSTSYVSLVIAHETIHTLGKIGHDKSWIDGDTDDPTQWEWWLYSNVR